jgi:hypothetical protein
MTAMRFTATATRSGRRWALHFLEHPAAVSQMPRLEEAADVHRETIASSPVDDEDFAVHVRSERALVRVKSSRPPGEVPGGLRLRRLEPTRQR